MGSEWALLTVKELIDLNIIEKPLDGNHGSTPPKGDDFISEGIPFIMASDLKYGHVDLKNCSFISKKQADSLRKGFSKLGDVLLSHKATIGRTALVGKINTSYIMLTPQVTYYRVKDHTKLNNRYLKYYFDSKPFQDLFSSWAGGGSTRAYLGITAQQKLPICLPPISEQKAIAHILGSLDDKIELNRKMNEALEAMAQALFKSWFVDFDPVIDNALAAGKSIPKELQERSEQRKNLGDTRKRLPKEIQKLFPDEFVKMDEMGWMPKGWKVTPIGSILELAYGKALPSQRRLLGPYPVYGSGGVNGWHHEAFVEGPGIIVGRKGTVGSVFWEERDFFPIDTVFFVKLKKTIPLFWVYKNLCQMDITSLGADSAVPGVNRNAVHAQKWVVPNDDILKLYQSRVASFNQKTRLLAEQNASLTVIRDSLLPKLICGELQIPEFKKQKEKML